MAPRAIVQPDPTRAADRLAGGVLVFAAVVFVALRWPCVHMPLERDEGEYAYIAQRLLAGDVPYRDVFDQKPPGVFLAYLPAVALFGTSVAAIHVTLYLVTAAAAVFVWRIGRLLFGAAPATFAVLIFGLLTIEPAWLGAAANTEQFMLLPLAAGLWCALRAAESDRPARWCFAAGALAMTACWFKQVAAFNAAFILAVALFYPSASPRGWRRRLATAAAFACGAAAGAAPVLLYFALAGAWSPFLDCVLLHNVRYSGQVGLVEGLENLGYALRRQWVALALVWALALLGLVDHRHSSRRGVLVMLGLLLTSLVGVSVGLYFREHYFLQLAPALALAAAAGLGRLIPLAAPSPRRAVLAAAAAAALCVPTLVGSPGYWRGGVEEKTRRLYGINPFVESAAYAGLIASRTAPTDRVLIYGSEPQILFLAQRRSATRYIFFYPLMMATPDAARRQEEVCDEIKADPPRCIVITNLYFSLLTQPGASTLVQQRLGELIGRERYDLVALRQVDGRSIRLLHDAAAGAAYRQAAQAGSADGLDMLVFIRP